MIVWPVAAETASDERHRLWAAHVAGLESLELEAGTLDQHLDRAIEMTTAAQACPDGRQLVLPPAHIWFRRTAMFDKQKTPGGLEHPIYLAERALGVGDAAQGPRRHDCVDGSILQRDRLGRAFDKFDWT